MVYGFNCGKGLIGLRFNGDKGLIGLGFNWLKGSINIKGLIGSIGLRVRLVRLVQGEIG